MDTAVYLFTGFLDSGKTAFLKETLDDQRFSTGEKTLILLCEEGEVELDTQGLVDKNAFVEIIDDPNSINIPNLKKLQKQYDARRIMIEYNGMWQLPDLYGAMPDNWILYQEITFADSNTYLTYNQNMRNLVYDKLVNCELAVFNRCTDKTDKMALHKIVRGVNHRCDIIYEYKNGEVEFDEIEDPLPFDVNADVIEIDLRDFAIWYRDMLEDMYKYDGKKVKFTGVIAIDARMPKDCFIIGRPVMECCVDDIAFKGILATERSGMMKNGDWVVLTAMVSIEKHKLYRGEGPVLKMSDYAVTSVPAEPVATFY